jgi:hypothetical protein
MLTLLWAAAIVVAIGLQNDTEVPEEYVGVWQVTSAKNDGVEMPMPDNLDEVASTGECDFRELIICPSRLVIVSADGNATVAKVRVLVENNQLKLECTGIGYAATRDGTAYAILKVADDGLTFAFVGKNVEQIDVANAKEQLVLTATR